MDEELIENEDWVAKYVCKSASIREGRNVAFNLKEMNSIEDLVDNIRVNGEEPDIEAFVNVKLNPHVIFENEVTGKLKVKNYKSEEVAKSGIDLDEEEYEIPVENVSFSNSSNIDWIEVNSVKYPYWANFQDEVSIADEMDRIKEEQSILDKIMGTDFGLIPNCDSLDEFKDFLPDEDALEEL